MTKIPDPLISEITEVHLIETKLHPADLLFVFGTREGVDEFLEEIVRLWRGGFFKYCIVSGGNTVGDARSECEVLKLGMIQKGIPSKIILEENRALNTGENVIFSLPIIESSIGLKNVDSIIALGKVCTSRRYLMTLQRYWPDVHKMLVAVNYFSVPRNQWYLDQKFRERVLSEYRKIEPYKEAGFIVNWP